MWFLRGVAEFVHARVSETSKQTTERQSCKEKLFLRTSERLLHSPKKDRCCTCSRLPWQSGWWQVGLQQTWLKIFTSQLLSMSQKWDLSFSFKKIINIQSPHFTVLCPHWYSAARFADSTKPSFLASVVSHHLQRSSLWWYKLFYNDSWSIHISFVNSKQHICIFLAAKPPPSE